MTSFLTTNSRSAVVLVLSMVLIWVCMAGAPSAQPSAQLVHAYYFNRMPTEYKKQEFAHCFTERYGGEYHHPGTADERSGCARASQPFPTQCILRTRQDSNSMSYCPTPTIARHCFKAQGLGDTQYALGSGTVQSTGKLDLFNREAVEYLASLAKEIASYSVDALLLGPDFYYSPVEGIGSCCPRADDDRS